MFRKATLALVLAGSARRDEQAVVIYRNNIGESQKKLASDLRHAKDTEDCRDARKKSP